MTSRLLVCLWIFLIALSQHTPTHNNLLKGSLCLDSAYHVYFLHLFSHLLNSSLAHHHHHHHSVWYIVKISHLFFGHYCCHWNFSYTFTVSFKCIFPFSSSSYGFHCLVYLSPLILLLTQSVRWTKRESRTEDIITLRCFVCSQLLLLYTLYVFIRK